MAQWTIPAMNKNFLSQLILNKINISLVSTEICDQRRIKCDNQTNLSLCPTLWPWRRAYTYKDPSLIYKYRYTFGWTINCLNGRLSQLDLIIFMKKSQLWFNNFCEEIHARDCAFSDFWPVGSLVIPCQTSTFIGPHKKIERKIILKNRAEQGCKSQAWQIGPGRSGQQI